MNLGHTVPTSSQGTFSFSMGQNFQHSDHEMLQAMCFIPAPLTSNSRRMPEPEQKLIEGGVKMYQLWGLTSSFALNSALCATYAMSSATNQPRLHITAPTTRISRRRHFFESSDAMTNSLVVGDDLVIEEEIDYASADLSQNHWPLQEVGKPQDLLKPSLDWQSIFQRIYVDPFYHGTYDNNFKSFESMSALVDSVSHCIGQWSKMDTLPMTSL
jgi:hypothetical protein